MLALAELLDAERTLATVEEPLLVERADTGRMWLLWFAIGETDEVCRLTGHHAEGDRNQVFRRVVALIFSMAIFGLEIFVQSLQAFIFTVLTAQYISSAAAEEH